MDEGLETISQLRVYKLNGGSLSPDNLTRKDEVLAEHTSKIIEMRAKTAPFICHKNYDITKHISKRRDNRWLKDIARASGLMY